MRIRSHALVAFGLLALAAGVFLGIGWLASQKLAHVALLGIVLAALRLASDGWQPLRELVRATLVGTGASAVWLVFRTALPMRFEIGPGHPAQAALPSRLLHAHEIILKEARTMAKEASDSGDDGTNDLVVSDVIRTNELQVWFVAEHVVDMPLVRAK